MRLLIPLCLLLGLIAPISAEDAKVTIRTLAINATTFPELWAMGSGDAVPLVFSATQPSLPLRLDRVAPFTVYSGALDAKKKPTDASPTLIPLPDASSVLLLGWMREGKPRFLPIPDPFGTAKKDDWLLINSTSTPVAVQIGADSKPVIIKASAHQALRITAPSDGGVAVTFASNKDGEWRKFYSTYWPIHSDKRCLILLVQDETRIQVKQIFDELPKAAADGGAGQ